jgi:hypothetical protein
MPSTDTKPELTAKASMAQPISQPAVYANGLIQILTIYVLVEICSLKGKKIKEILYCIVEVIRNACCVVLRFKVSE